MNAPLLLRVLRTPASVATLTLSEWDLLLRQAVRSSMAATVLALLAEYGLLQCVPPQAREHLDWADALARRHAQAVRFEVARVQDVLGRLGLPLVLLKGAAYARAGLPAAQGRLFSDIDLLVPKASLAEVEAALMLEGWAGQHHDDYDQRYYRQWMHELPPLRHLRRSSVLDVHHALLPETAPLRPDPQLLLAAAHALPGEPSVKVLAPADMVLHSAAHLFCGEFDHGLRELFDLHRLLRHFGSEPRFWNTLPARARELELARPLFYALRYTRRMLDTAVPDHVLRALAPAAPNRATLALMDALFERALLPAHASCDGPCSPAARGALYLRANWLRMPPWLLARHLFHKAFLSPAKAAA